MAYRQKLIAGRVSIRIMGRAALWHSKGSVATDEVAYGVVVLGGRRSAEMQDFIGVARHRGCAARMSFI